MRNLIATIVGVVSNFILLTTAIYVFALLNIGPSRQIIQQNFNYESLRTIANYLIFGIFPITALGTGLITGLISKTKALWWCLLGVLPIIYISLHMPANYSLPAITFILLAMYFGDYSAVIIKDKIAEFRKTNENA
jgi:hypothetical protein